ncbi:aldehyde dehydrogenase family protein, partial [Bacteroidia bacterium]|nr:aldehyde dehydrogenase family protein [Bacteroidia bacterium]
IVHGIGSSTGNSIISSDNIDLVSFTGGTATGAHIAKVVAPKFKKMSLELGGKNPNIIFDDCNFDKALKTTINSSFANQGQICLCGSRILVQRGIYEKFRDAFVEKINKLKVGNPLEDDSRMGAIVSKPHYDKILSYIEIAKAEGGKILTGGNAINLDGDNAKGWFIAPTIIEGLNQQCRTNQEEIFGPVVTIQPFDTEEEALELANSTEYGLAATIWTSDLHKTHRLADKIKSGIIWVNCWLVRDLRTPFGGMKNSGVGREGGWEALDFFTEPKNVCIKY